MNTSLGRLIHLNASVHMNIHLQNTYTATTRTLRSIRMHRVLAIDTDRADPRTSGIAPRSSDSLHIKQADSPQTHCILCIYICPCLDQHPAPTLVAESSSKMERSVLVLWGLGGSEKTYAAFESFSKDHRAEMGRGRRHAQSRAIDWRFAKISCHAPCTIRSVQASISW